MCIRDRVNSIASAVKDFFDPQTVYAVELFGKEYSWATVITCIILTVCVGLVVIGEMCIRDRYQCNEV